MPHYPSFLFLRRAPALRFAAPLLLTAMLLLPAGLRSQGKTDKGTGGQGDKGKGKTSPPAVPSSSKAQIPQPPTPMPPPPPPPPPPLRLALVAPLSASMQQRAAHVDVDAGAFASSLPAFWRGNARPLPFVGEDAPRLEASAAPGMLLRKSLGATLVRLNPFATPGAVTLHPDGTPIVRWESVDAALTRAGQNGEQVIFDVQCPLDLSSEGWRALAEATLRRFRANSPAPIARWEAACGGEEAVRRYEPFVRLCRKIFPDTPVGLNIVTGKVEDIIKRVGQLCAQNKVPLDSLAWTMTGTPYEIIPQAQRVRTALAAFPTLKNALLLPTLVLHAPASSAAAANEVSVGSGAYLASLVSRLMTTVPASAPNPLVGALWAESEQTGKTGSKARESAGASDTPEPQQNAAMDDVAQTQTLALFTRMAGTRVRAQSDGAGIGCLAARSQARVFVLLWREPPMMRAPGRSSSPPEASSALAVVRLRHLALEKGGALRVTHWDVSTTGASMQLASATPATAAPLRAANAPAEDANASLPAAGTADATWDGATVPDVVEAPVLLAPGGVCLLEVAPRKPKTLPLVLTLATANSSLSGGDNMDVILTARSLSAKPQTLAVALASPVPDWLPSNVSLLKLGALAAGSARAFRFALRVPILGADSHVTLNARAGDSSTSLTVPVSTPLQATLPVPRTNVENGTGRANVTVRLVNRSHTPLGIHLQAGEAAGTRVSVPPNGKPVEAVLAVTPSSREPGLYRAAISLDAQGRKLQILHPLLGVPYFCAYMAAKPTLDGDLQEWSESAPMGMGRAEQARGKAWGGPNDISAYAYARWDEKFFYFACAVTDDIFTPPTNAAHLEQGDSVVFALAATADKEKEKPQHLTPTYAKFGMALLKNDKGALTPALVRLTSAKAKGGVETPVVVKNARIAIRQEGTRTFYEAAVPWSELLPGPASPQTALALHIMVSDVDGQARGSMEWGGDGSGIVNPALFPPLRLVK